MQTGHNSSILTQHHVVFTNIYLCGRLLITIWHSSPTPIIPNDCIIVKTSPGAVECEFVNTKTDIATWFTPEGMSAADILAIPDAKKYWSTIEEVERYIELMNKEKAKNGGKDIKDSV